MNEKYGYDAALVLSILVLVVMLEFFAILWFS